MSGPIDSTAVSDRANENVQTTTSGDVSRLAERLDALERQLTDGEPVADLEDLSDLEDRLSVLEESMADLEETVAELEAATQAVRGYVGSIRAVNREVERRADLALARTERIERRADLPTDDPAVPDPDAVAAAVPDDEPVHQPNDEPCVDGDVLSRLRDAL